MFTAHTSTTDTMPYSPTIVLLKFDSHHNFRDRDCDEWYHRGMG